MTLSNEELQQIAADGFIKHGDAKVMARELLERRERDKQEPVAWRKFVPCEWNNMLDTYQYFDAPGKPGQREPLYAAPPAPDVMQEIHRWAIDRGLVGRGHYTPEQNAVIDAYIGLTESSAPVVPAQCPAEIRDLMASHCDELFDDDDAQQIWNACRAAMHGSTISNSADIAIDEGGQSFGNSEQLEPASQTYTLRDGLEAIRKLGPIDTGKIQAERDALNEPTCWCLTCRPVTMTDMRFVVCPDCGNKRCPKANDHSNACSGSNEPGQEGSAYPAAPKQESE